VQESARDQNNFGLRVGQHPLSDVVNKVIVFELSEVGNAVVTFVIAPLPPFQLRWKPGMQMLCKVCLLFPLSALLLLYCAVFQPHISLFATVGTVYVTGKCFCLLLNHQTSLFTLYTFKIFYIAMSKLKSIKEQKVGIYFLGNCEINCLTDLKLITINYCSRILDKLYISTCFVYSLFLFNLIANINFHSQNIKDRIAWVKLNMCCTATGTV